MVGSVGMTEVLTKSVSLSAHVEKEFRLIFNETFLLKKDLIYQVTEIVITVEDSHLSFKKSGLELVSNLKKSLLHVLAVELCGVSRYGILFWDAVEDPVRIFEHQPAPPHSVLKLFVDLFSASQTAALFYTNDTKVLIDIIVRQLADLSPGDNVSFNNIVSRN
jgi:hypothetical protein